MSIPITDGRDRRFWLDRFRTGERRLSFVGLYPVFLFQTLERDWDYTIPTTASAWLPPYRCAQGHLRLQRSAHVVFKTGRAFSKNSSISVQSSVTYGTSIPVEVTIKDRWGNPLGGHLIEVYGDGSGDR